MALPPLDPQQRRNLLAGTLLLVLAGYGFWNWLLSPRNTQIAEMETRLAALETANSAARARTRGPGGEIEQTLEHARRQLEVVEGLIPSSEELPDLLDAISVEAQRTGVEISLIQPAGATEEPHYTRQTYDMAVRGRYHDIGEFLTRVASLPRVVTPMNVTLAAEPAPANAPARPAAGAQAPTEAPRLEARFTIETYVIPTDPISDASVE